MIGAHLLTSRVRVLRPQASMQDGILTMVWKAVVGLEDVAMRFDVGLFRPGKDFPLPPQAGRSPDRVAVYWAPPSVDIRPGDHLECISGPVAGTWQVRVAPDQSTNMNQLHHIEGQCIELPRQVAAGAPT